MLCLVMSYTLCFSRLIFIAILIQLEVVIKYTVTINANLNEMFAQVVDTQDRKTKIKLSTGKYARCVRRHAENGTQTDLAALRD